MNTTQTINKISFTELKKKKLDNTEFIPIQINPYFNLESWSAQTVHITKQVTDLTYVTYHRQTRMVLIPDKGNVTASLHPYYNELKKLLRVDAPVISVFSGKRKIAELTEPKA